MVASFSNDLGCNINGRYNEKKGGSLSLSVFEVKSKLYVNW
jgi:hypothetical protein